MIVAKVMPGDIRYKDVNGDGVINDNDMLFPIGATTVEFNLWLRCIRSMERAGFQRTFPGEPASHPSSLTDSQYTHSQVVTGEMY